MELSTGDILGIVATGVAAIALAAAFLIEEARTTLISVIRRLGVTTTYILLAAVGAGLVGLHQVTWGIVLIVGIVCMAIYRTRRVESLESTNKELDRIISRQDTQITNLNAELSRFTEKPIPIYRWNAITCVSYGHFRYPPLLDYNINNSPIGLGPTLLNELLCKPIDGKVIKLQPKGPPQSWSEALTGLAQNRYEVVATPMFATFSRATRVSFTMPLFFSNVGLFINKRYRQSKGAQLSAMRVEDADIFIKQHQNLRFLAISGEISEALAKDYIDKEEWCDRIKLFDSATSLDELYDEIGDSDGMLAMFCETFYAHFKDRVMSLDRTGSPGRVGDPDARDVVNVLFSHQILYPVCFAVRLGDYQLANLLNIRLLEYAGKQKDGALGRLAKQLADDPTLSIREEQVYEHFVAQWPHEWSKKESENE